MNVLSNEPFLLRHEHPHAVLLLHGLGGGVFELSLLGQRLHEQGVSVCGINYPGHDKPVRRMPASRWEQWYAHVEETYHQLAQHHDVVSVIGFSTGSLLSLELASRYPVHNLILLSPFLKLRHQWYYGLRPENYIRFFGSMLGSVPRMPPRLHDRAMKTAAMQTSPFKTFNINAVASALELIERIKPKLPQITAPSLIIQSSHDHVVCPSGASYLMAHLGSTKKELVWLNRSNHVITLDVERDDVTRHIVRFLNV